MVSYQEKVRSLEFASLYFGLPVFLFVADIPFFFRLPLLIALSLVFLAVLLRDRRFDRKRLFSVRRWHHFILVALPRFAILFAATATLSRFLPEGAVALVSPREYPWLWTGALLAYPLFSVLPQGLVFRVFLFHRYRKLFPENLLILLSAMLFSFTHIIYQNPLALAFTLVGGYFFADTYRRTHSLILSSAEHALYGIGLFVLGFGQYFFSP